MNDYGTLIAPDAIRFERLLPGPIERVWAFITESEKRARWLASGEMPLTVGSRFQMRFRHADLTPHDEVTPERYKAIEDGVTMDFAITACEPPRLLRHTWPEGSSESEVTYELKPEGKAVRLVLTHRRLSHEAMHQVGPGWHAHLDILAEHIAGRTPPPFWATHARLEADYSQRLGEDLGRKSA